MAKCDCTNAQLFYECFSALSDYVEVELAKLAYGAFQTSFIPQKPPLYVRYPLLQKLMWWKVWRSKDAGLGYLAWLEEKSPPVSKEVITEIKALYLWWTEERPARIETFDTLTNGSLAADQEDDMMLLRLIRARGFVW